MALLGVGVDGYWAWAILTQTKGKKKDAVKD
jgi:hypothetical protein